MFVVVAMIVLTVVNTKLLFNQIRGDQGSVTRKNPLVFITWPLNQLCLLHQGRSISTSRKVLNNHVSAHIDHSWERLQHHFWKKHILKVTENVNHQFEWLWSLLLQSHVKSCLTIFIRVKQNKRHVNIMAFHRLIFVSTEKFMMDHLNYLWIRRKIMEKRISIVNLVELNKFCAFSNMLYFLSQVNDTVPE